MMAAMQAMEAMEASRPPPSSSKAAHGKQAACLNCRRSKIRCNRKETESICEKCKLGGLECIIPKHHVGRQKGVKK